MSVCGKRQKMDDVLRTDRKNVLLNLHGSGYISVDIKRITSRGVTISYSAMNSQKKTLHVEDFTKFALQVGFAPSINTRVLLRDPSSKTWFPGVVIAQVEIPRTISYFTTDGIRVRLENDGRIFESGLSVKDVAIRDFKIQGDDGFRDSIQAKINIGAHSDRPLNFGLEENFESKSEWKNALSAQQRIKPALNNFMIKRPHDANVSQTFHQSSSASGMFVGDQQTQALLQKQTPMTKQAIEEQVIFQKYLVDIMVPALNHFEAVYDKNAPQRGYELENDFRADPHVAAQYLEGQIEGFLVQVTHVTENEGLLEYARLNFHNWWAERDNNECSRVPELEKYMQTLIDILDRKVERLNYHADPMPPGFDKIEALKGVSGIIHAENQLTEELDDIGTDTSKLKPLSDNDHMTDIPLA